MSVTPFLVGFCLYYLFEPFLWAKLGRKIYPSSMWGFIRAREYSRVKNVSEMFKDKDKLRFSLSRSFLESIFPTLFAVAIWFMVGDDGWKGALIIAGIIQIMFLCRTLLIWLFSETLINGFSRLD